MCRAHPNRRIGAEVLSAPGGCVIGAEGGSAGRPCEVQRTLGPAGLALGSAGLRGRRRRVGSQALARWNVGESDLVRRGFEPRNLHVACKKLHRRCKVETHRRFWVGMAHEHSDSLDGVAEPVQTNDQ